MKCYASFTIYHCIQIIHKNVFISKAIKEIMSTNISSDDAQMLLDDRVKFKIYAAEQHLNELKNIKQRHGSIMGPPEIRVKTEMALDCFLAHVIGAKDSLLVQINYQLGLGLSIEDVKLDTIKAELDTINKGDLLDHLNSLTSKKTSWFWLLNEIRNHSLHRERMPRRVHVNIIENINDNTSHSDQTIHFVENDRTKDNPFLQQDIILFLHESLDRMRNLIDNVRRNFKH
jgi:hypothetical protein